MGKYAINEEFLQDIETLEMIIKNNVAGLFGGMHQSKSFGSSCEFADYRNYLPGDDISKIDWNQYARSENLYLKQYLDERRLNTKIYIDASRSMELNTKKADKALQIAAAFAYISLACMDKVSIYYIQNDIVYEVVVNMVGKDQFYTSINKINDIVFDGSFRFSEAIRNANVGYGDGLSVIISDFLLAIGNTLVSVIIGHIGAAFVAANAIMAQVMRMSTVFTQGVSSASSVMIGNRLQRKRANSLSISVVIYLRMKMIDMALPQRNNG